MSKILGHHLETSKNIKGSNGRKYVDRMPEMVKVPKKDFEEMEKGFKDMRKEIKEWEATLETLKDEEVMKQIRQSEKEIQEGKGESWKEVKKDL